MELSTEQIKKILELADKSKEVDINTISQIDISKALIEIERKLNFFDVDVNFKADNKNILIVDDLELSLFQLNQLMKKIGFRTFVARNKAEAQAELIKRNFDYVLIDLFLPDSADGFSLIRETVELKNLGKQNCKIIVISGSDDNALIDESYKLGVNGYVQKTENWHNDILKYINTPSEKQENNLFYKENVNNDTVFYSLKKFNDKKIFEKLKNDINSETLGGTAFIIMNLEKVMVFDQDNTYIFAEIYKTCQNSEGAFLLINPSEKIKEALSSAYLEGVIPVFNSIENAKEYIIEFKNANNI